MIIVNADDWGRSPDETDAALACVEARRVSSLTAMVFMADSERAAKLADTASVAVGLHLNLTEPFSGVVRPASLRERHERVARFLSSGRFACLVYNPALRSDFRYVYEAQRAEFERLYGRRPSHVDGHQHQHLCANVLLDRVIPNGEAVRRSFYFWPGEKGAANRAYRFLVNRILAQRYQGTDFFFALAHCLDHQRMERVIALARTRTVELMTHPVIPEERDYLLSDNWVSWLNGVEQGDYSMLSWV